MEAVRDIRLHGALGAKFGRHHRYVIKSPRDAIKALCSMVRGFERELMTSRDRGITYAVFVGKRNISESELAYPSGDASVRIAPVVSGSKAGGLFQTIAGVALAAVGGVTAFLGNPFAGQMMLLGASMALGGVAQMLSPHATAANGSSNRKQSYYFNGAENVTAQGGPVPLIYGRIRAGSTVASEGITSSDR
ncbi:MULTISPECIES: tail assembly protein [pseudomallei group]|nr:tail assembly protein [Burkholderia pseudomallei]MUV20848.1 tail assembly protein [Burkholderia thailandensis]AYX28491.1 tail assembly protein [Burkholderia pseudomallei]AYX36842.1 tail assembly protein [Burkholderia pseudomallei]MBD2919709.1 tail assembly protein [Burkholderia pseudomallei]MBD3002075.1 tail assembly protein [Burkholderia pseudomallei]